MKMVPWLPASGAVLALVALALVAWWLRTRPYRNVFRIPSRRDDSFTCRGEHPTFSVLAMPDGFELPAGVVGGGQSAFLTLRVEATPMGRLVDPFIEFWHGKARYRQYFERGAAGRRHLNLSPLFQDGGRSALTRVNLRGSAIHWKGEARLALFEPPTLRDAEVLVLAPHADDAEIATFGMYVGHKAWVVTITAGDAGMASFSEVVPHNAHSAQWSALLRVWDSLTIPQLGGVPPERCLNLAYPDGRLRQMYEQPDRAFSVACEKERSRRMLRLRNPAAEFQGGDPQCTWKGLIDELRCLLEKAKPDVVLCPHPLVDGHHDHVFTTVAIEEALRRASHKSPLFLLYVVHRRDVPLYPFGPRMGLVSFPPWTDEQWLADSIYSHPLAADVQQTKYFAVEATHDLRTYTTGEPGTLGQVLTTLKQEISALLSGTGRPAASFLRRAPRPNEIYSVVSAESLSELVRRALAHDSGAGA